MTDVLLISTYELGRQPFGLASPAAWLKAAGADVVTLDLAVEPLDEHLVRQASLIGLYLPMHTATRLVAQLLPGLRALNPQAHLCCFGLYAPTNEPYLRQLGVESILGGEFESGLVAVFKRVAELGLSARTAQQPEPKVSLTRQQFLVPAREDLPPLNAYARLLHPDGEETLVGYTEASRGCKYRCRHCPIVPIYNGRFRIVQPDIVLADIRQQVTAGAGHITFGDPDFLNGPGHTLPIVHQLHQEFPDLTYDVTIKIEHLIEHDRLLPQLADTGCALITSAVESVDDGVLDLLDKGHTREDFSNAVSRLRELGLILNPTFVAFNPWTSVEGYLDMLSVIRQLDLIGNVSPIQYAIRLLIPEGSRLLELAEVRSLVRPFDQEALSYPWDHPDPAMDRLYERVFRLVQQNQRREESRASLFSRIRQAAAEFAPENEQSRVRREGWEMATAPVPRLSESWY